MCQETASYPRAFYSTLPGDSLRLEGICKPLCAGQMRIIDMAERFKKIKERLLVAKKLLFDLKQNRPSRIVDSVR